MMPIIPAAHGSTQLQLAVMETNPARIPLVKPWKSILMFLFWPEMYFLVNKVNMPEAAGEMIVLRMASLACLPSSPMIPRDEPPLKSNHPSHKISVPRTTY